MEPRHTTAIVCSGGGMRCSYSAGVLVALAKEFAISGPDMAIGSSGSAGTLAYYGARQHEAIEHIWLSLLSSPSFINPWRFWNIMNLEYLIEEVFKRQAPLAIEKLQASRSNILIAATSIHSGKEVFFDLRDRATNPFEVLRASKAMPFICGDRVPIAGDVYIDGSIKVRTIRLLREAFDRGATRVVVIDNSNEIPSTLYKIIFRMSLGFKVRIPNVKPLSPDEASKVVWVRPSRKLPVGLLTNNPVLLRDMFRLGYEDALRHPLLPSTLS